MDRRQEPRSLVEQAKTTTEFYAILALIGIGPSQLDDDDWNEMRLADLWQYIDRSLKGDS